MCRFFAYSGSPVHLEDLLYDQPVSLVRQSLHALEAKTEVNGDGFGLGWYGERETPGLYRETGPAWSDSNLASISHHIRARLFFAHVRSATHGGVERTNCHPFASGRHLFMHNGQIAGYAGMRRDIEALIPDALYNQRTGTTDSEALFLAALGRGLADDPEAAMASIVGDALAIMRNHGEAGAFRFAAALSDGMSIWAWRWSSDPRVPTLYWRRLGEGIAVSSEPYDLDPEAWHALDPGTMIEVTPGLDVKVAAFAVTGPA